MPERLPRNSCDAHLHVFGSATAYPVTNKNALYRPPEDATFEDMCKLHDELGIDRAVLVQPTIYGTDHGLLVDVLERAPAGRYRGIAIIGDDISDAELQRLDQAGVRGARFNFRADFKLSPDFATLHRTLDRIGSLGWIAKIFAFGDEIVALEPELRKIRIPAVIDHMGALDYRRGTSQPAVQLILDLLRHDNWWIMLSNGDRRSNSGYPWDDAVEFGRLFFAAAPERCLWGTDWPHVHRLIRPEKDGDSECGPDDELRRIALLERYVANRAARDKILVDNPARLFRFEG